MADNFNILDRGLYPPKEWLLPTGVLAATQPRSARLGNGFAQLVSGQQTLYGIYLPAGTLVTNLVFYSAQTAAIAPTSQWFSLYNSALGKLAVTADDTSTAWGSNTRKSLALSSPYTVPTSGFYYAGIMVAAGTVPTIIAIDHSQTIVAAQAPVLFGRDTTNTGLTTPATAPATAATLNTGILALAYVEIT